MGSAIFNDSVHPCKIVPSLRPPCRVAYGGAEREHNGRYDLLPITPDMEWVPTRDGGLPHGRRLVEGGYESNGAKLYHALADIDGVKVPGKTAGHLVSRFVTFALCGPSFRAHGSGISLGRREYTFWRIRTRRPRVQDSVSNSPCVRYFDLELI